MVRQVKEVLFEATSTFEKGYPDVPLAEGIDYEALTKGDEDPFFLTLPVGKIDTVSRNERIYRRKAVETIRDAINHNRVGGILGHLRDDQRPYEFHIPVIHWVGAVIEGDLLWAKGYIPRTQPDLREYMRISMKTNARVGTSIYGTAEIDDNGLVLNLWIESIDLAHPDRVGVEAAALVPLVTSETHREGTMNGNAPPAVQEGYEFRARIRRAIWTKVNDRPDYEEVVARIADQMEVTLGQLYDLMNSTDPIPDDKLQVFSTELNIPLDDLRDLAAANPDPESNDKTTTELQPETESTAEVDAMDAKDKKPAGQETPPADDPVSELTRQHQEAVRGYTLRIGELENLLKDYQKIREMLGIGEKDDGIIKVMAVNTELANLRRENGELLEATIKAEVAAKVAVETVRPVIESIVRERKPARRVDVTVAIQEVMERDDIKSLLRVSVAQEMGPSQSRPSTPVTEAEMTGRIVIPGY